MTNSKFRTGLIVSLILHLLILVSIGQPSKSEQKQGEKKNKGEKRLNTRIQLPAQYGGQGNDCENGYVGIGVVVNFFRIITQVAPGSPADEAGLQVNDELTTRINNAELQEGQVLTVHFQRKAQKFTKKIKVEKICK